MTRYSTKQTSFCPSGGHYQPALWRGEVSLLLSYLPLPQQYATSYLIEYHTLYKGRSPNHPQWWHSRGYSGLPPGCALFSQRWRRVRREPPTLRQWQRNILWYALPDWLQQQLNNLSLEGRVSKGKPESLIALDPLLLDTVFWSFLVFCAWSMGKEKDIDTCPSTAGI
jgi:hypothetical protein